jgi:hypothetical protein
MIFSCQACKKNSFLDIDAVNDFSLCSYIDIYITTGILMTYLEYLEKKSGIPAKQRPYFQQWVSQYLGYQSTEVENPTITGFEKSLIGKYVDWQINQAVIAVKHYLFYINNYSEKNEILSNQNEISIPEKDLWSKSREIMKNMLRLRHRSYKTEKSYLKWIDSFQAFTGNQPPASLTESDVKSFLTYLAVERRVSVSTQNQAFNALLYFFRNVLEISITNLGDTIRSKIPSRLPVVLSISEIQSIFSFLDNPYKLMASLVYGGGMPFPQDQRSGFKSS